MGHTSMCCPSLGEGPELRLAVPLESWWQRWILVVTPARGEGGRLWQDEAEQVLIKAFLKPWVGAGKRAERATAALPGAAGKTTS